MMDAMIWKKQKASRWKDSQSVARTTHRAILVCEGFFTTQMIPVTVTFDFAMWPFSWSMMFFPVRSLDPVFPLDWPGFATITRFLQNVWTAWVTPHSVLHYVTLCYMCVTCVLHCGLSNTTSVKSTLFSISLWINSDSLWLAIQSLTSISNSYSAPCFYFEAISLKTDLCVLPVNFKTGHPHLYLYSAPCFLKLTWECLRSLKSTLGRDTHIQVETLAPPGKWLMAGPEYNRCPRQIWIFLTIAFVVKQD